MDQTIEADSDQVPLWTSNKNDSMAQEVPPDYTSEASGSGPGVSGNMTSMGSDNTTNHAPRSAGPRTNAAAASNNSSVFSLEFYAWYFDIDTADVARRCVLACNPFNKSPFVDLEDQESMSNITPVIGGHGPPDLYGPFWICTTVVFVLFFASTVMGLLFSSWQGIEYLYRFDLLTGAAFLMYGYTFVVPIGLWLVIRYLNLAPAVSALQLVCLYGYSNVIWIPVAILSISPLFGTPTISNIIRWVFIAIGFAFSGTFIAKNLYKCLVPQVHSDTLAVDRRPASLLVAGALFLHVVLAFAVKMLFFSGIKIEN